MTKNSSALPRIAGASKSPKTAGDQGLRGATIAIYSVKGGVGKTTLAANLAWNAAASSGRRTLLWDLDAASGAGFLLGVPPDQQHHAEKIFSKERDPAKLIRPTAYERLDILPADESLRALDTQFLNIGKRRRLAKLTETLGKDYERILLDCPPVLNEVSAQVLRAADLVIVPLPPSPLSARALDLIIRQVADDGARHAPILPVHSMLDLRRSLHKAPSTPTRTGQPSLTPAQWNNAPFGNARSAHLRLPALPRRPLPGYGARSRRVWGSFRRHMMPYGARIVPQSPRNAA